ncbi:O-methyltransferase [Ferruginibacter sp. HRS2-29]|uniref:O-methyltransferase n=1 Tax=Ferruginibacter sp. HRS2-29 TaxID=2487334 RepID=UPI0020CB9D20|nr:class I SAM-dependent methyltransferase [Ferruginibacter sp. HRS2-29]MCP9750258.1 O-methyltransferase [Ferruginibacter sp. HRS2-29]
MTELVNIKAEQYSEKFSSALDAVSEEVARETYAQHPHAHMLSGHVQGVFLEIISRMIRPQRILEIGTFTGFSALCLAKGLEENGLLHTIEIREEDAATSLANFEKAGATKNIRLHTGDARTIIPTLKEAWDIVFIDADKVSYIDYYELTLPLIKPGGYILADNVLFHGQVLEEEVKGKNALAIQAFNAHVAKDQRVQQVLLTVRDGLMLIRKK